MAEEKRQEDHKEGHGRSASSASTEEQQTGDPGRTPGKAEGDEQTVEEDLSRKAGEGQR